MRRFLTNIKYLLLVVGFILSASTPSVVLAREDDKNGKAPIRARLEVVDAAIKYKGKAITLRGVAVGDVLLTRPERSGTDYRTIARTWNANTVRLSVHPYSWKTDSALALELLEQNIKDALKNGLFVIIDWHTIGWPDGFYAQPNDIRDLYDSDFTLAMDFWATISEKFGEDGRIVFELWNVPMFDEADYIPDQASRWESFKPYMEKLLTAVREYSQNVVLVTGNNGGFNLRSIKDNLIDDHQTAYSWHVYSGHGDNDSNKWLENLDGLNSVKPVVVTEWGFENKAGTHYSGTVENFGIPFTERFLTTLGLHSIAWCWNPYWGPAMLESDWATPTEFGKFVKSYLTSSNKTNKSAAKKNKSKN